MKTILCYGDSNTRGSDPATRDRYPLDVRWPGVLRNALGPGYWVIEEGLGGRTTIWDDPIEGADRNGRTYFIPCLDTHRPLDLVIILLGTNDLKRRFHLSAGDIAAGASQLARIAQNSAAGPNGGPPKVLMLCPPPLAPLAGTPLEALFDGAEETSRQLATHYERLARHYGYEFMDTGKIIVSSPIDGIHWAASEHRKLGEAVAEKVRQMLAAD